MVQRLQKQAACDSQEDWSKLQIEERRCVLLNHDGECSIYEYRPIACRKNVSMSNADYCDVSQGIREYVKPICIEAEAITVLLAEKEKGIDYFSKLLLTAIKEDKPEPR